MKTHSILQLVASSHGGGATHVRDLVVGLDHQHYQPTVAMPLDGGNVTPEDFTDTGIEFIPVDIAAGFSWKSIAHLRGLIQQHDFDLVHMHGARAALYGRLAVAAIRPRPKMVFTIHGFATPFHPQPKHFLYLRLEKMLQQWTDHTIGVAQAESNLFLSFGLTEASRNSTIPYGIDVARFTEAPNLDTTSLQNELGLEAGPIILTVCRISVPRDFVSLLTAFQRVYAEFPAARLLIVGDGPQRNEVETLIQDLALTKVAQITGFRDDIPQLMALADIYVLTSYGWEGYPISTLEAQAAGVPVVVTDAGGSKEAV
ncbi:MAG: glycosyltransferase, partial [Chloroflexota bacterium]